VLLLEQSITTLCHVAASLDMIVDDWKRPAVIIRSESLALSILNRTASILQPILPIYDQLDALQQGHAALGLRAFFRLSKRYQPSSQGVFESIVQELVRHPSSLLALPSWVICKLLSALSTIPPNTTIFIDVLEQVTTGCITTASSSSCCGCTFLAAPTRPTTSDAQRAQLTLHQKLATLLLQAIDKQLSAWTLLVDVAVRLTCSQCRLPSLFKLVMTNDDILYSIATALMGLSAERQGTLGLTATSTFVAVLVVMEATPSGLVEATLDDGAAFLEFMLAGLRSLGAQVGHDGLAEFPIPLLRGYCKQLTNYHTKGLMTFNVEPLLRRLVAIVGEPNRNE
jgi:hypothetical protein